MTQVRDDFPADTRTLTLSPTEFAQGGTQVLRFRLLNSDHETALYLRLSCEQSWVRVAPQEVVLGPGEKQSVAVTVAVTEARNALQVGGPPSAPVLLQTQRLGGPGSAPLPTVSTQVYVRLPIALCPACEKTLDADLTDGTTIPEVCPFCYERLRGCPQCGTPNSWIATTCIADDRHILRSGLEWPMLGGSPAHEGARMASGSGLIRRWSFPSVAPSRLEQTLAWSAPVTAYGLVVAAAATPSGEAHIYAFHAQSGAPLWDPYPLGDPIYPERGGAAIASGAIFAATVEGTLVSVDVQRGTRLWERTLPGRVFGTVVPASDTGPLLVPLATKTGGTLLQLDLKTGETLASTPLSGTPDTAPAASDERVFVHDDSGKITAIELGMGAVLWEAQASSGFDAAPVLADGKVFSAASNGVVYAHSQADGTRLWEFAVTNAPFAGTPACDGALLYLPADDGLHLVSAATGRAVRRYPTDRPVRSAPIILSGAAFFGCTDGGVYGALPGRTLERVYETGSVGSQIVAAPAFLDGVIFLTATNGVLYSLVLA